MRRMREAKRMTVTSPAGTKLDIRIEGARVGMIP